MPEWFETLSAYTPDSIWTQGPSYDLGRVSDHFGARPIILKDYVKSAKHYWNEATFVPDATDQSRLESVVKRFLELRDGEPEGGLVFREYLNLKGVGTHSVSGMPLTLEYRYFFYRGQELTSSRYWGEGEYPVAELPSELIKVAVPQISSPFFTMDVACDIAGRWWIVELGDGQVSGLPDDLAPETFYARLRDLVKGEGLNKIEGAEMIEK